MLKHRAEFHVGSAESTIAIATSIRVVVVLFLLIANCAFTTAQPERERDQNAIQLLRTSLDAMGGHRMWANVHSSLVRGRETRPDGTSETLTLANDWSNGLVMYSEHRDASGDTRKYHQSAGKVSMGSGGRLSQSKIPEKDPIETLIAYLPAAAIDHILSGHSYSVQLSKERNDPSETTCVAIAPQSTPSTHVRLCISNATHLPSTVYLEMPNLLKPSSHVTEMVSFSDFDQSEGLLVPKTITTQKPNGMRTTISLTETHVNPAINIDALAEANQ